MGSTQWIRISAIAACVLAGASILAAYLGGFGTKSSSPPTAELGRPAAGRSARTSPVSPPQAQSTPVASSCPAEALAQPEGPHDGLFQLEPALSPDAKTSALVAVAREAQQQGRSRDAEVALIAACHAAEREAGARSAPVADVKSQLGQHYVALSAHAGSEPQREQLHRRAEGLWSDSAQAYASALGRSASKTRLANQRLASLQAMAPANPATARMGAARGTSESAQQAAQALANVPVPALARSDPELAQLQRDLDRLHAQAARVARDPAGMRRREAQALAQRDARCQDKACLLRWYAQRRRQLLAEF